VDTAVWIVLGLSGALCVGVALWAVATLRSVPRWIEDLGPEEREEDEPGWSP